MVAFLKKQGIKEEGHHAGKLREEIKAMVKGLLEKLMVEERAMDLEDHPTKANGYDTRDLLTLYGSVEDLRVPRVREGGFRPALFPKRRRASLELSEVILSSLRCGGESSGHPPFLEGVYGFPRASPA